jgi:ABC-type transport system involved in cytochrome c biogenesis permease component
MIRMALHMFGYDLRGFARNRQSRFFTLALPVLFLVIFASVFGGSGHTTTVAGGRISTSAYYVPGIIALGVIAACFGSLVASVTAQRERGVLKRRRATPVPAAVVIAGRVLTAVVIAVVMAAALLGIGWAAYGAHVPGRTALALAVTVVIGAASFCCMGYALTSLIRNEDAALPAAMAITLPLYFISCPHVQLAAARTLTPTATPPTITGGDHGQGSPDPSRTMPHARNSPGNPGSPATGIPLRRLRHLAGRRPAPPIPLPRMRSSCPDGLSPGRP